MATNKRILERKRRRGLVNNMSALRSAIRRSCEEVTILERHIACCLVELKQETDPEWRRWLQNSLVESNQKLASHEGLVGELSDTERQLRKLKFKTMRRYQPSSELEVLELSLSEARKRHKKGWKTTWTPTRKRYWQPMNNNWKQHRKQQYRVL